MAGGKETPRQKMIGMMYLVLTALLALQVSNSVLERFIFINESLEQAVNDNQTKNSNIVERIKTAVDEAGNREGDVKVLDKAKLLRQETQEIIKYMTDLKEEMIKITGGRDSDGALAGAKNDEDVANMMINKKKGYELQKKLNGYAEFLSKETGRKFDKLAYDGKEHPYFSSDPNQKRKDFPALYFEKTPTAAGLSTMTQLQTEVLNYETIALDELARKVGAEDVKFDKIRPMVRPEAKVVAAGTKYKAEMFIAASSSGITPSMFYNGKELDVIDGTGIVEFTATASNYDKDGLSEQSYDAAISMTLPGGRDTTYREKITYVVAKPTIQIQSASVQALYLNCGNELNVQVPQLGAAYDPSFSTSGGSSYKGAKKGMVTIVPNSAKVVLTVSNSGFTIGREEFRVRRIPKPTVSVLSRGKPLDEKTGETAPGPTSVTMAAIPDESFKEFLPKDARYLVTKWEITLARGPRAVMQPKRVSGPNANISDFASKARSGDRLVIEVKEIQRMNFQDKKEVVNMGGPVIKTIPIN